MNDELNRLKQDLKTMEQVIRREPEFDQRHVWISIGWGIWGVLFVLCGLIPRTVPPYLLAAVMMVLLIALPILLPKLACGELPPPPVGDRQINSKSAALLLTALSLGIIFWVSRMTPTPKNLVLALILLLTATWALFSSWGKYWWRGLLAYAAAFGAAGVVMPFLPQGMVSPTMGCAMIFGGFIGAAILHQQLKAYDAHGKAAH